MACSEPLDVRLAHCSMKHRRKTSLTVASCSHFKSHGHHSTPPTHHIGPPLQPQTIIQDSHNGPKV